MRENLESNNVKSILPDDDSDRAYIGTHAGGMKIYYRATGKIEHLSVDVEIPEAQNVYSILERDEKSLWIGTLGGLYIYHKQSRKFERVERDKNGSEIIRQQINVLFKDNAGRLWIGGKHELEIYDVESGKLVKRNFPFNKMSSVSEVQCIYEATDETFWVATRNGLFHLNLSNGAVENFTVREGLLSNVIYGIEEDAYSFIWFSSNKGLTSYDQYKKIFRHYTINDGLQGEEFNSYSHCKTADGTMYFGGVKGITVFNPQELLDNPHAPNVYITDFLLYNKRVMPGDETGILKENISEAKRIVLSPSQRAFTLKYVVSNYVSGKHNTFAYKLEGYDKDWNYTTERSVFYSNLSPGDYRFVVKAANGDGLWCKGLTALNIKVLPEWYNTWWARLVFVLSIVAVVSLVMKYFWEKKSMKTRLMMERQEKQHQEEINQMKTRFFINISHELRTPLTLIISPVQEVLAKSTDKWVRQQLMYIERNANRLLHIINQLMDYRRAELEVFKLNVTMADAYQMVKDSFSYYEKLAGTKGLKYSFESDIQGRNVLVDTKYLDLILNNLLSNAFKYTEEGYISVALSLDNEYLVIVVEDSGTGIPKEKQKKIFDRFYQLDSEHLGSGIGLSLVQKLVELHHGRIELWSEPGKGSRFSVFIPQDKSVYSAEEINHDNEEVSSGFFTNTSEMFVIDNENSETEVMLSDGDKKGTVLVVEDNAEVRNYLSQGLSDLFNVITAENGKQALEVVKNNEVDIIVSDVMMPVMDGIKLCKSIKQNVCTSHIPVVMLSAKTDLTAQGEAMVFGADDYIPKPFSLGLLIAKLRNMIFTRRRIIDKYMQTAEIEPEKITFNALDEEFIKKAKKVVEDNMDNGEFSTQDFADLMNMSRSNLHQKLKAITGESAIDFIRKIRFAEACRLLKEGQYTIAEISTMVGFNTPSYFATSFKKYMGCLPTEYVKKQ